MAHQQEINRLDQSINQRELLYNNNLLSDEGLKEAMMDIGRRRFLQIDLEKLQTRKY